MIAEVEQPDGHFDFLEMGDPECGKDFCDGCGDCLACQFHDNEKWCDSGVPRWVIYLDDKKNPHRTLPSTTEEQT